MRHDGKTMVGQAYLDTETTVDLRNTLVVFPDDTELNDTLGDLDDVEGLLVLGVGGQEGLEGGGELVERLLELGLDGEDHVSCSVRGSGSGLGRSCSSGSSSNRSRCRLWSGSGGRS